MNATELPYAAMTQRKAIIEIVKQEPSLEGDEITERQRFRLQRP